MSEAFGTFSVVGADLKTGDVGVAVASKFLAVGPVVPYAKAGVGAVATQAFGNTTYGPRGLELLARKLHPHSLRTTLGAISDKLGLSTHRGVMQPTQASSVSLGQAGLQAKTLLCRAISLWARQW